LSDLGITQGDIQAAAARIAGRVLRTPLLSSIELEESTGIPVFLKLENLQRTGSFKLRGATNRMLQLSDDERRRGVVTVSSGNHGRAVGHIARRLDIGAVVCLPETVPANKIDAIRRGGATVRVAGATYDEASEHARRLQRDEGRVPIHPFDDAAIIAGQGTIGAEILADRPDIDTVLVPMSGGGLISGVALAVKAERPGVRVIGVCMERAPVMHESLRAGHVVSLEEEPTLADALAGGLGGENHFTFRICREMVDESLLVPEESIVRAMRFLLDVHHLVVEGGGAVGVAALLDGRLADAGCTAIVVSGGNVSMTTLLDIARGSGEEPGAQAGPTT